jgi:PAS domain S-box-containing protein
MRSRARVLVAAGLLTVAICAMGAAIITPDPTIIVYPSFMDNTTMALAVAGVTLLVMLAGLAAALIEKQTVQESVVRLHELADAAAEGIIVAKDGEIINVNQRISELTGWTGPHMLGKKVFGDLLVASRQVRSTLGDRPIETLMITAAGEAIPVEVIWKQYRSGLRATFVICKSGGLPRRPSAVSRIMIPSPDFPIGRP